MTTKIKEFFFEKIGLFKNNPIGLFSKFLEVVVIFLITLESGFLFFKFGASSRLKIITLGSLFFVIILLYLTTVRLSDIKDIIKKKRFPKPSFSFCFLAFYTLIILLSFLFNSNKSLNLYSYLDILILVWCAILFAKTVSFERFCILYSKTIGIICVIALVFYAVANIVDLPFSSSVYFHNGYLVENYNGFYFDYSTNLSLFSSASSNRLLAIFWEPGVFASHLLIVLVIDFVIIKKTNLIFAVLKLICLFLTFSTAGWLCLPFVIIAFISEKFKKTTYWFLHNIIITSVGAILVSFVIIFFKNKIFLGDGSLATRLLSPYYSMLVFLKKPIFGFGPFSANQYYYSIAPENVSAMSSTFGFFMMSIGFFGAFFLVLPLIGILRKKDLSLFTRIVLCIFFILTTNKENQSSIFSIFFFYFYFIFDNIYFKYEKKEKSELKDSIIGNLVFKKKTTVSSNVFWAFCVKIATFIVGLIIVPVLNSYFGNDTDYGVWTTIISILSWILLFDFGFSNGLRSKLSASLQTGNDDASKKYISSTYRVSLIFGILIIIVGIILAFTLNWNGIYNIDTSLLDSSRLSICMAIVLSSVGIQFALRPILSILESMKMSALANSLALFSNILLVLFATMASRISSEGSFIGLATAYLFFVNGPLILATVIVFMRHKELIPSLRIEKDHEIVGSLLKLNIVFFLIQISQLFLYGVNDLLISNMFDPSYVSSYVKYYKLFANILSTFTGVFQAPLWVSLSRAKEQGDTKKIKKISATTFKIGLVFLAVSLAVCCSLPFIFDIWLGDKAPYFSWTIALVFFSDAAIRIMCCTLTIVGNGLGAVKSQAFIFFIAALAKVPLSILLKEILPTEFSFSVVILSGDLIIWTVLIILPFEIRNKIRAIGNKKRIISV